MMAGRSAPALGVRLAVVSALTTWITLFAWGGFVASPGAYLNPLVGALALVAAVGVLSRWARLAPLLVLGTQLLVVLVYANVAWGSSLLPTLDSLRAMWATYESAIQSAREYAAPVPDEAPSVAPLLISGGMLCGLLVDFFAVTLRRVPVAGLPLLMIYSLPVSALDRSVNWLIFSLSALGFLAMLSLQERDRIGRWGRTLSVDEVDSARLRHRHGQAAHPGDRRLRDRAGGLPAGADPDPGPQRLRRRDRRPRRWRRPRRPDHQPDDRPASRPGARRGPAADAGPDQPAEPGVPPHLAADRLHRAGLDTRRP